MIELRGARIVVVGMGKSGIAAVKLLVEQGADVVAMDQKPVTVAELERLAVRVSMQEPAGIGAADLVVLSPGVPADCEVAQAARERSIPVIGDLELASWFLQGDTIGITGSNGKTTTTALTGHILAECGIEAQVGGNIGTPPTEMIATSRPGLWNVLELSSFQLETTESFRARVAVILNVTPDHLDRHKTFANYAGAKFRLLRNQSPEDCAVLNADDKTVRQQAGETPARKLWFSLSGALPHQTNEGAWLNGEELILNGSVLMPIAEIPLRGLHNVENVMAAAIVASQAGASQDAIRQAVMSFPGVEHRLEHVAEIDGVAWYNDSKATNVDAALKAVAAFPGKLWIILGGTDKGSDYRPLVRALKSKVRGVLLIGAAAPLIAEQIGADLEFTHCQTMQRAVAEAADHAQPGDTVLLAPACASFDQYKNYEERGRDFKKLVSALAGRQGGSAWRN